MRIIKSFVMTAVFLLVLESLTSADMMGMSLQKRMGQADTVVVGTIEEVHQTDAGVGGQFPPPVTHWLATCRVERYIIGPKIHNPNVEEAKAVRLIRIAFEHRLQKPVLVKLVAGKKYLLFLKEIGPNEYEMITPYHGAFEAGQDYFVHDEQSPEYPQAVKMSFEEIVQRVTPHNPAENPPTDQASCEAQGGRWGRFGLMEKEQCNQPTTDAGKKCSDHSECEGNCVAEDSVPAGTEVTGRCCGWTIELGTCFNGVKDGKAQGVICVD